ncbi:permease-like cell division protein FtsX [Nitrincola tapanii]|uniref:Cell division protein FtsX n=1 Tax=Nitrincola tapanii TaxID=1708751 RepID=A0A5A9W2X5_9GAMM|nr:permease-like cell division protein FtsX [Nitrincola tapanii]KAA0874478.1 FtsX-like permease family protein [Nitrincola tapanii]
MAEKSNTVARRGAQVHRVSQRNRLSSWLRHHLSVALTSLQRILRTPLASFMTLAVLAIALALPSFMWTVVHNVQQFAAGWDTHPRISLYLHQQVSDERAEQMSLELMLHPGLSGVELIDRDKGLQDFARYSEFANLISLFERNPLPAVILVLPTDHTLLALQGLQQELSVLPEVQEAQLDLEWLQRLGAYLNVLERFTWVVSGLLALAVLLIVGNTLRMTLESRRDEIIVTKLVGATDAWVRRPFLYTGFWLGLCGAILASVLVFLAMEMIRAPVDRLAQLYMSSFSLQGLGAQGLTTLIAIGVALGWLGAFVSTGRHLREIEPS